MEANYNRSMGIEKSKKRAKRMALTVGKINRAMKSDEKEVAKDDADESTAESEDESGSEEELLEQEETSEVDKTENK